MKREYLRFAILLMLGTILFGANIGGYNLWAPDEPRFGQVAREMLQSGDFLVPRINGEPYKEKPPLLFWLAAAASWPFGDVTETSARIVPVCLGVLTVAMAYWIGKRLYGIEVGVWSAAVLMTSSLFFREARSLRTDILLTACVTAFLCAHMVWTDARRIRWLIAMYAALAAGLLAKGPPALIFPVLFLITYYWRRWDDARGLHPLIGIGVAVVVVLAWFIPARMAVTGVADSHATVGVGQEAYRQIIGRVFASSSGHPRPPWYYLLNLPVSLLPWTFLLPWTLPWVWRNRDDKSTRVLLAWLVPSLIFFSIISGKREMYLLPAYPAMAVLFARSTMELAAPGHIVWRRRTAYLWALVLLGFGVASFAFLATEYRDLWTPGIGVFGVVAFGCCLQMMWDMRKDVLVHRRMFQHFCVLGVLTTLVIFPVIDARKGVSAICAPVRQLAESHATFRMYTAGFASEEYIFYSRHFRKEVLNTPYELPELTGKARGDLEKRQERLRGAVEKAVNRIPVANSLLPTDDERRAITDAVAGAIRDTAKDPVLASAYQAASDAAFDAFARELSEPTAAFLYIDLRDWKRLALLIPDLAQYRILQQSPIGSHTILLIANPAAAEPYS